MPPQGALLTPPGVSLPGLETPELPQTPLGSPPGLSPVEPAPPGAAPAECFESATSTAPSFRPMIEAVSVQGGSVATSLPEPGQHIGEFDLLWVLGSGSFGRVYLARQLPLDRHVALKVTGNCGSEARTLASLEHDHIVHVFSETVDRERGLRLLCMQYVPGTTLQRVVEALRSRPRSKWTGEVILEVVDRLSLHPAILYPAALRDREVLADADFIEAACWIGAPLAEALHYAHCQGVLHRDIKPANILINQYGRPLLADFNLSLHPRRLVTAMVIGGTLGYMAPEHLDALNPGDGAPAVAVDQRADIYSLGVVLFEMLTGQRPFEQALSGAEVRQALQAAAALRRCSVPSSRQLNPDIPEVLDQVVRRCLDPDSQRRYQTGADLARVLEGCRQMRRIEKELPAAGPLTRCVLRRPFILMVLLALLPHLLGSAVNIVYNSALIVGGLTAAQQTVFAHMVIGYNLLVYPSCLYAVYRLLLPAAGIWRALAGGDPVDREQAAAVRQRVLAFPQWVLGLSCAGWLPGGILFPLGIHMLAGPVRAEVFGHFFSSFAISGLIALTYSFFATQFVVLRVVYPRLWAEPQDVRETTAKELRSLPPRLWLFQLLAGAIPLAGAVLMNAVGPETSSDRGFRLLLTVLIVMGMVGFGSAILINRLLGQTLAVLTGSPRRLSPGTDSLP